jgi:hypothetical protein
LHQALLLVDEIEHEQVPVRPGSGGRFLRRVASGSKKGELAFALASMLAEWTGLEPATPGVTGRYSNQLNYHSCEFACSLLLVGAERLELPTFAL